MIPSRPTGWLKRYFGRVVEGRLAKTFAQVRVRGLEPLRQLAQRSPLLFVSNHTSWWDPIFLIYLSTRLLRLQGYAMMEARNLRRLPFLGRLGGFGVDLSDPADRSAAVAYSAELLQAPGQAVWIFPQGRERPAHDRAQGFLPGAAVVASRVEALPIVPVGLRYEFCHLEKPFMLVSIGEPIAFAGDVEQCRRRQEEAVEQELVRVDQALRDLSAARDFEVVLTSRSSWIGRALERALAWLTRYA